MSGKRMIELFRIQKIEKHGDCIVVSHDPYSDKPNFCIPLRSVVCATGKEMTVKRMLTDIETRLHVVTLRMIDDVEIKLCGISLSNWMALAYPAKVATKRLHKANKKEG